MIDRHIIKYKGGRVCPLPHLQPNHCVAAGHLRERLKLPRKVLIEVVRTGDNLLKEFQSLMRKSTCLIYFPKECDRKRCQKNIVLNRNLILVKFGGLKNLKIEERQKENVHSVCVCVISQ